MMHLNWDFPSPFTLEVDVQSSDIDGLGHTNNANYVIWCERCAWKHSESLGLSVSNYQELDRGVAIHHADYNYYLPSFKADRLVIGTWLVKCDGKLRLQRCFQVINRDSGQILLRGQWELISVTLSTGKATRLPQQFVDAYSKAVISPS